MPEKILCPACARVWTRSENGMCSTCERDRHGLNAAERERKRINKRERKRKACGH